MNAQTKVVIRPPVTPDEFAEYYDLRYRVLRKPFGYEPDSARDEYDDMVCLQLAAFMYQSIVGVARLHRDPDGMFVVRWVAVDPNQRHRHVGSLLLQALEDEARCLGAKQIELVARNNALGFYAKLGYNEMGIASPVRNVAGKPVMEQTKMSKTL